MRVISEKEMAILTAFSIANSTKHAVAKELREPLPARLSPMAEGRVTGLFRKFGLLSSPSDPRINEIRPQLKGLRRSVYRIAIIDEGLAKIFLLVLFFTAATYLLSADNNHAKMYVVATSLTYFLIATCYTILVHEAYILAIRKKDVTFLLWQFSVENSIIVGKMFAFYQFCSLYASDSDPNFMAITIIPLIYHLCSHFYLVSYIFNIYRGRQILAAIDNVAIEPEVAVILV